MQLSYLLCLALQSAAIATSEGKDRHTTCKAGHKCKTTATVTSTTTSAAPTPTAYQIVQCVDNLPLACCDVVSDGRTVENGKFDNITLFAGCKCFLLGAIGDTDSSFPATGIPPLRTIDTNQASCPIPGKEGDCCTVVDYVDATATDCKLAVTLGQNHQCYVCVTTSESSDGIGSESIRFHRQSSFY